MKKVLLLGAATLLFTIGIIGFSSCDEDGNVLSCTKLLLEMTEASSAYTQNPTKVIRCKEQ